jgi:hypothetical protein
MIHTGCRDFNGPVPQSLLMTHQVLRIRTAVSRVLARAHV